VFEDDLEEENKEIYQEKYLDEATLQKEGNKRRLAYLIRAKLI